ncbi:histidine phosphatase family protein [Aquabacterium sp. J223]|uniref:SixA phosphatase family protein n=1 Tax=Aquabacterium sp. J223 TaxID=2898431 RepID=UPI0021ADE3A8|nr:histidine phosphatase family protein [Aquabacterium sp. J223]UUX95977.1 histidine phosphatase family protein [Aquabacterium sp. J223]
MDLLLWRHAEAHDARPGQDDLSRALTERGERQARLMADWLAERLPADARLIASPARRTQQTVQALGRPYDTVQALAPDAAVDAVLQAARWPNAGRTVVVVGHQPTLGRVAATLLGGQAQYWEVDKGAVWWLRREPPGAGPAARLLAVRGPDAP